MINTEIQEMITKVSDILRGRYIGDNKIVGLVYIGTKTHGGTCIRIALDCSGSSQPKLFSSTITGYIPSKVLSSVESTTRYITKRYNICKIYNISKTKYLVGISSESYPDLYYNFRIVHGVNSIVDAQNKYIKLFHKSGLNKCEDLITLDVSHISANKISRIVRNYSNCGVINKCEMMDLLIYIINYKK